MSTLFAILAGFGLDLLLGDPLPLPHPVVWMGKAIDILERILRRLFQPGPKGELWAGRVLALVLPLASFGLSLGLLSLCGLVSPWLRFMVESWMCYQILATRELWRQSAQVAAALEKQGLSAARLAVGRIVGRDTSALNETGVIKAAVETVAENASDGVVAPLIFMALGGAPLGFFYKAINTMDSMVGYKNTQYLYFGRAAAKLDDAANFLPARFCALCMVAASALCGLSPGGAYRIWRRDGRNHQSPNSAQTEAACAGALGLQLAGDAVYFGKTISKPTIGDALRPIEPGDIRRANRLMLSSALLALAVCGGLRVAIYFVITNIFL